MHVKTLTSQKRRALLTARKLLQEKAIAIENDIRGLLRKFGLKVSIVGAVKFEDRIRELLEGRSDLAEITTPLLAARRTLREEFSRLHRKVLEITRDDVICNRLITIPGVGAVTALAFTSTIDIPARFRNSRWLPAAEQVEPRAGTKGNASQQSMRWAQDRESVIPALYRIRTAARHRKKERFTALFHHINLEALRMAFYALKRDAAPGADGMTWRAYEQELDRKIEELHQRVQRGAYRPQPSRRTYIPKPDGRQRPLAVAALEDKIVQRATATILNQIYEEEFLGFSYGFRPERGQHDALNALYVGLETRKVNYILDADIRSFFDEVSQDWLVRFIEHRIAW